MKHNLFFILKIFIFLLLSTVSSYSFELVFNPNTVLSPWDNNQNHTPHTPQTRMINIRFGFLGNDDYEKRKNYFDSCFSERCAGFGINFKINFTQ